MQETKTLLFPIFEEAKQQDVKRLQDFLIENKLKPSISINENSIYLIALIDGQIMGSIGAEFNTHCALIRAAGVAQPYRGKGIGKNLFQHLVAKLESKNIFNLYLFSRQAAEFWTSTGFTKCTVEEVIEALPHAPQVMEFVADGSIWTDVAWRRQLK